jgi:thymidylate kinase
MIYIVEGPDGAGKTTLVNRLQEMFGYPVKHRNKPKNEEEKQMMLAGYAYDIATGGNFIYDRCWYSEMVYGPVMRDASVITADQMVALEEAIVRNGGGIIIHCTDATNILWNRCTSRGEDYITSRDTLDDIREGFEQLLHHTRHLLPVVRYELSKNMH